MAHTDLVGHHVNHTGRTLQKVIEQINQRLPIATHTIRPAHDLTLQERAAVLTFANLDCRWTNHLPTHRIDTVDADGLKEFMRLYPRIFTPVTTPVA